MFPVDQVDGMHDVAVKDIEPLPVTLTNVAVVYTQGLFHSGRKTVAIIDESLLFGAWCGGSREQSRRILDVGPLPRRGRIADARLHRWTARAGERRFREGAACRDDAGGAFDQGGRAHRTSRCGRQLAHAMEDCLVAAQEGALTLDPAAIDVLLSAGDLLARLSTLEESAVPAWVEEQSSAVDQLLSQLADVRSRQNCAPAPPDCAASCCATVAAPPRQSSER